MKNVGDIIYSQIGGNRAMAMISGTAVAGENSLAISFKGSRKSNLVSIKLESNDTYTITFYKFKNKIDVIKVKEVKEAYCDQLTSIFEDFTGLNLSL